MDYAEYFAAAEEVLGPSHPISALEQYMIIANISDRYERVITRVANAFMAQKKETEAKRVLIGSIKSFADGIK